MCRKTRLQLRLCIDTQSWFWCFSTVLQTGLLEQLKSFQNYVGEATAAYNESKIIYTSMVSVYLDIWIMDSDWWNKKQTTDSGSVNFGSFFYQVVTR